MRLVRVAVPVPALDALTYSIPDDLPTPTVGARVLVPVGSRTMTGDVVDRDSQLAVRKVQHRPARDHKKRTANRERRAANRRGQSSHSSTSSTPTPFFPLTS